MVFFYKLSTVHTSIQLCKEFEAREELIAEIEKEAAGAGADLERGAAPAGAASAPAATSSGEPMREGSLAAQDANAAGARAACAAIAG